MKKLTIKLRPAWPLILLLAAAAGLWLAWPSRATSPPASPAVPTVAVTPVTRADLAQEVTIAGEFRPYAEVELHAKVTGYVKELRVDFGDRVKAGQVLATLEIPELEADLRYARAARERARADYQATHLAFTRLVTVNTGHPNLVARQDVDAAEARDQAAAAAVSGAEADSARYQTMVDYSQITAPFDGIITRRSVDPGALIQAGTSADPQAKSLLRLADNFRLRLDFPVSVAYAAAIHTGDRVNVRVDSLGGRRLTGTITRFSHQVDDDTRTMMTEMEIPNDNLELIPGMYATVVLQTSRRTQALAVPVQAVTSGNPPLVCVVNAAGVLEARPVQLGLETPAQYEILAGLAAGEQVLVGSHAGLTPGQTVVPQLADPLTLTLKP